MIGRIYLDPGSRLTGRNDPPRRCIVLVKWGSGGGLRNVLVRYEDDNSEAVIPFPGRLRRLALEIKPGQEYRPDTSIQAPRRVRRI
jgi:hypothetical protein